MNTDQYFVVLTTDEHSKNYTILSNHVLRDTSISYHARFLLAWLLSYKKPQTGFKYSAELISRKVDMPLSRVRTTLQELQAAGYLKIERTRNGPRFGLSVWYIHETPVASVENVEVIEDTVEDPVQEYEAPTVTEIIIPTQLKFEQFWEKYPKKSNYDKARKEFLSISDIDTVFPQIMDALEVQIKSKQWREENGRYIPNPENYLKKASWNNIVVKKYSEEEMAQIMEDWK